MRVGPWLLVAALVWGCGYRFVGGDASLPGVRSVAIETPRNESFEPGIEFVVADALRRELLRRGGAALTEEPGGADLVISGRVAGLKSRARSLSSVALALEYEVRVSLELVTRGRDGEALGVSEDVFAETERYLSSADVEVERKNRDEAVRRVASVLAARYLDEIGRAHV